MTRVVWLASYPRAGNTWARMLIGNLLWGNEAEYNNMQIARYIPDLHDPIHPPRLISSKELGGETAIFKTHSDYGRRILDADFSFNYLDQEHAAETAGVVYVIRNPLDIVCSVFDFMTLAEGQVWWCVSEQDRLKRFHDFVRLFCDKQGDIREIAPNLATTNLVQHSINWMHTAENHRALIMRYEEIHLKPLETMTRLSLYFSTPKSDEDLMTIYESCAFNRLRSAEDALISAQGTPANPSHGDDHAEGSEFFRKSRMSAYGHGQRFFNKGLVGRSKQILSKEETSMILECFSPVFELFYQDQHEIA